MDESTASPVNGTTDRMPLGMSSFGPEDREQFGRNLRLAMACIEGKVAPVDTRNMPSDIPAIRQRLMGLSQYMTSQHADLLELLVKFDDMEGYKASGASHCAAWMNLEIGIHLKLAWEYLRVGRKLQRLPTTRALFRGGKLSWSKVRVMVNVANEENEKILCHAALDASVSDVVGLCKGYRWNDDELDENAGESARALQRWEARSLTWDEASNGNTRIRLSLPPEIARAFLNSVEHSLNQMEESDDKFTQRRADAAVLMAETSLQAAGRDFAVADRYQVIVSVDANELAGKRSRHDVASDTESITHSNTSSITNLAAASSDNSGLETVTNPRLTPITHSGLTPITHSGLTPVSEPNPTTTTAPNPAQSVHLDTAPTTVFSTTPNTNSDCASNTDSVNPSCTKPDTTQHEKSNRILPLQTSSTESTVHSFETPAKRPTVRGAGPIAHETARRIACDCCVTTNATSNGEPVDIGRKSRLWPPAMARAIKERDQHCQFYGCNQSHNLQIHHIVHWADGGHTCVSNGVCLCQHHHTMVHEGGYTIQMVDNNEQRLQEQFIRQTHGSDTSLTTVEKKLRTNRPSFTKVRSLLPTRYRFRIVDHQGQDIRDNPAYDVNARSVAFSLPREQFQNTAHSSSSQITAETAHSPPPESSGETAHSSTQAGVTCNSHSSSVDSSERPQHSYSSSSENTFRATSVEDARGIYDCSQSNYFGQSNTPGYENNDISRATITEVDSGRRKSKGMVSYRRKLMPAESSSRNCTCVDNNSKHSTRVDNSSRNSTRADNSSRNSTRVDNSCRHSTRADNSSRNSTRADNSSRNPTRVDSSSKHSTRVDNSSRNSTRADNSCKNSTRVDNSGRHSTRVDNSCRHPTRVDNSGRHSTRVDNSCRKSSDVDNFDKKSTHAVSINEKSSNADSLIYFLVSSPMDNIEDGEQFENPATYSVSTQASSGSICQITKTSKIVMPDNLYFRGTSWFQQSGQHRTVGGVLADNPKPLANNQRPLADNCRSSNKLTPANTLTQASQTHQNDERIPGLIASLNTLGDTSFQKSRIQSNRSLTNPQIHEPTTSRHHSFNQKRQFL